MWSYIYAQTPASVADPPADGGDAIANSGVWEGIEKPESDAGDDLGINLRLLLICIVAVIALVWIFYLVKKIINK